MKLRHAIGGLFRRRQKAKRRESQSETEKARETEQLVQAGIAANKFPPR